MLPFAFILIFTKLLRSEAIPQSEQLHHVLSSLFEYDQPIDVPGVEANTILSIKHELGQELESDEYDLVVLMERIQSAFDYCREVLWIKPVEE